MERGSRASALSLTLTLVGSCLIASWIEFLGEGGERGERAGAPLVSTLKQEENSCNVAHITRSTVSSLNTLCKR